MAESNGTKDQASDGLTLRAATSEDGSDVWQLIRESGPLDENSMYCNTLQCDHFGETCVIAELEGQIVGWVSAFILPNAPDTLFIWQVAVDSKARGMGVARRMLEHLLARDVCADIKRLQTTITADNEASWALFNSFADHMDATLEREPHYKRDTHFEGRHATEYMVTISEIEASEARKTATEDGKAKVAP